MKSAPVVIGCIGAAVFCGAAGAQVHTLPNVPQAIPAALREQLSDTRASLAAAAKAAVEETYRANGQLPQEEMDSNNSYGLPESASIAGQYVSSVTVAGGSGVITITYNVEAVGAGMTQNTDTLTLTPFATQAGIGWLCGNTTDQTGKVVGQGTTVQAKYLPAECRP